MPFLSKNSWYKNLCLAFAWMTLAQHSWGRIRYLFSQASLKFKVGKRGKLRLSGAAQLGFKYVRSRGEETWILQKRKITIDYIKQFSGFCFKVYCSPFCYKKKSVNLFFRNETHGVHHLLILIAKVKRKKGTACFILLCFPAMMNTC